MDDSTHSPHPPWKVRLKSFSTPCSKVEEFTVGNLLYAHYLHEGDSKLARASIAASLGIEDTRDFSKWYSLRLSTAKGKEGELKRGGTQDTVNKFLHSRLSVPFTSQLHSNLPDDSSSSSSNPILDSSSSFSPSVNIPPIAVDLSIDNSSPQCVFSPSTTLSSLNLASPSSSTSLKSTIQQFSSTVSKPLPLSPNIVSPSSSTAHSNRIHPLSPSTSVFSSSSHVFASPSIHILSTPSIPIPSSSLPSTSSSLSVSPLLSSSPPSKSARISIPGATPRGRPLSERTGMRKEDLHDSIQSVRSFYLGELETVKCVLSTVRESARKERKHSTSLLKRLNVANGKLGLDSGKAAAKRGGAVTQKEREQAKTIDQLRRKVRTLESRTAPVPVSDDVFVTKSRDGFLPQVKYAALRLATLNVSDSKQGEVMEVVATMLGVRLSHIPAESTIRDWVPALNALNQMHAAEMIDNSGGGLTLLRDETTKKGDKIQQHAIGFARDQTLFLGFTAVVDKSALVAFDALRAKVESLSHFSSSSSRSSTFYSFVLKIQNLMSDRASTETLFNKLFASVREAYLELSEGWDGLSPEEKEKASMLCVHFCQLHAVANLYGIVSSELNAHSSESRSHPEDSSSAGFAIVLKEDSLK